MTLAFYKVGNSKGYERHTFDMWCDGPQEIKEMLSELKDDELHLKTTTTMRFLMADGGV